MTILIIGAAGMIGRKLAGSFQTEPLILADAFAPPRPSQRHLPDP